MTTHRNTCIVIASDIEATAYFNHQFPSSNLVEDWLFYSLPSLYVLITGMGYGNTFCATYHFFRNFRIHEVIQIGLSGAHIHSLEIGDIILGDSVRDFSIHTKTNHGELEPRSHLMQKQGSTQRYENLKVDSNLTQKIQQLFVKNHISFQVGRVGSADQFNRDPVFIQKVNRLYGTFCEDMESAATAHVCQRLAIPFTTIRIISNNELVEKHQSKEGEVFSSSAFERLNTVGQVLNQQWGKSG